MQHMTRACLILSLVLSGCAPSVAPADFDRYDACEMGWSCAAECHAPTRALVDLGCSPGDFSSVPPMCATTDNCANAKTECFQQCDADENASEIECKIECDHLYGNGSVCKENFAAWQLARAEVMQPYTTCLRPCEGKVSRLDCRNGESQCDTVVFAQHTGVSKIEACALGDESACDWSCADPYTGFPR